MRSPYNVQIPLSNLALSNYTSGKWMAVPIYRVVHLILYTVAYFWEICKALCKRKLFSWHKVLSLTRLATFRQSIWYNQTSYSWVRVKHLLVACYISSEPSWVLVMHLVGAAVNITYRIERDGSSCLWIIIIFRVTLIGFFFLPVLQIVII